MAFVDAILEYTAFVVPNGIVSINKISFSGNIIKSKYSKNCICGVFPIRSTTFYVGLVSLT